MLFGIWKDGTVEFSDILHKSRSRFAASSVVCAGFSCKKINK